MTRDLKVGLNREGKVAIILSPDAYDHLIKELLHVSNELISHCKNDEQKKTLAQNAPVLISLSRQPTYREIIYKVQEQVKKKI